MLHFGRNTRVTGRMDMLPRGSSDGSSGSHGMGMVCHSYSLCRCLFLYISFGESLCPLPQNAGKIIQEWELEQWEISLETQREEKKMSKTDKAFQLKTYFFQAQASHQKLKTCWWAKRAGFTTEVAAFQQWGRIAGPAHPGSPGLICLSSPSWDLEGDHKPPSALASYCNWWSSCQCAVILDIAGLKIVPVFFYYFFFSKLVVFRALKI